MSDLREKIARIVFDLDMKHRQDSFIDADKCADRILALPEIAEAMDKAKRWDKASMDALDD